MSHIKGVGAYAPRARISAREFETAWGRFHAAGIREKAVANADEDTVTMAYEAATRALTAAETDGSAVDWLGFASARHPVAEEDLTARLGAMLGINESATRYAFAESTRAGTRALFAGVDAIKAGATNGLVVAADAPRGDPDSDVDHAAGAGAAAFVLGSDGPARITARSEYAAPYPGTRFRNIGEEVTRELGVTQYDRLAFMETVGNAVAALEPNMDFDAVAIQAPDGKLPYRAANSIGVGVEEIQAAATVHDLGDIGAASVPVSLANVLEKGHKSVLAASYGNGAGSDAAIVESDGDVPALLALDGEESITYAEYLRLRGVVTSGPPSGGGAYVSVPSWRRSLPQRYRLEVGRCIACDTLSFPPEGACTDCNSTEGYEPVELTGDGTLEAVTNISQGGAPPEFAEQQARSGDYAAVIVALDTDSRDDPVSVPAMGTDAKPTAFEVGDRVETTIRRIYTQEGVTRYGFKVRPSSET